MTAQPIFARSPLIPFFFMLLCICSKSVVSTCVTEESVCYCLFDQTSNGDVLSLPRLLQSCCQKSVFTIHLRGPLLSRLPANTFYQVPCHNLIEVHVADTSLDFNSEGLAADGLSFGGLPNLKTLQLTGNKRLTNLPKAAFSSLGMSLQKLNLSANSLVAFSGHEFDGLSGENNHLAYLDLSKNRISALQLGWFPQVQGQFRHLSLAGNLIEELGPAMLQGFQHLEELDLRENPLKAIIGGTFSRMSKLRQLLISGMEISPDYNGLGRLSPAMLHGLNNLQKLQLSDLRISTINVDTFLELRMLLDLDLSGNILREIPVAALERLSITQRIRLTSLDLSNNQISCLPSGGFAKLTRLRLLNLAGNKISVVGSLALQGLKGLYEVNLQNNPIKLIAPDAFSHFTTDEGLRIVHHPEPRVPFSDLITGESTPKRKTVKLPKSINIEKNFTDLMLDSCPVAVQITSITRTTKEWQKEIELLREEPTFLNSRLSIILITVCVLLTFVVTSAIAISCRGCRKKRKAQYTGKPALGVYSSASRLQFSRSSNTPKAFTTHSQFHFQQCCLFGRRGSSVKAEMAECEFGRMTKKQRLFSLGQKLAPPPYPHNIPTVQEKLFQTVTGTSIGYLCQSPQLITNQRQQDMHIPGSGDSSPNLSNLGSSPGFSSSSSMLRTVTTGTGGPATASSTGHLIDCDHLANKPGNISPQHESGIVSDNTSSLITALGIL